MSDDYPRKVLVSPGYGAGFATWAGKNAKALAEDPELVALVEAGKHRGTTTVTALAASLADDPDAPQVDPKFLASSEESEYRNRIECSLEFARRAWIVGGGYTYMGGVASLEVRLVDGPYRITEYDGAEGLETLSSTDWW